MNDVKLFFSDNVNGVISPKIENGDLVSEDGLETSVLISLFTDRRVRDEDLPYTHTSKRGWWGDVFADVDQDLTGSRFWLLTREKRVPSVLRKFEDYTREALAWMIEDGVAEAVNVSAFFSVEKFAMIDIEIKRPKSNDIKYRLNWDNQLLVRR